jgi:hypothetical protein
MQSAGKHAFYFEHYKLLEWKDFVEKLEESASAASPPKRRNGLVMDVSETSLKLGLIWTPSIGQPARQANSKAVTIAPGETARLSINGRYTSYSGQFYTETTYNVAFGGRISNDVFIKVEPAAVFDLRADLF